MFGKRNDSYVSKTYRSKVFGEEKDLGAIILSRSVNGFYKYKSNNCSMKEILSRNEKTDKTEEKESTKGSVSQTTQMDTLNKCEQEKYIDENQITPPANNINDENNSTNKKIIVNRSKSIDMLSFSKNETEKENKKEDKICHNCFNDEIRQHTTKLPNKHNSTTEIVDNKLSLHESTEKLRKSIIEKRIRNRETLSHVVSESIYDFKKNDRSAREKQKLQEINQNEKFFFYKDKRDTSVERAKLRYQKNDELIQNFVKEKKYSSDLRPSITSYYNKIIQLRSSNNNADEYTNSDLVEEINTQRSLLSAYQQELKEQIMEKINIKKISKQKEKDYITKATSEEAEKIQKEKDTLENERKNKKYLFIKTNNELKEYKQKFNESEKEKRRLEAETDRKIKDLYINEMKEIKQKNDKYKKLMLQILDKQVEEKKLKANAYKEERIRTKPDLSVNNCNNYDICTGCKRSILQK